MAEEGNHDWAAHANDGATAIWNIIGLSDAVERALEFTKNIRMKLLSLLLLIMKQEALPWVGQEKKLRN